MPKPQLLQKQLVVTLFLLIGIFKNSFSQQTDQQKLALEQKILADKKVEAVKISDERATPSSIYFNLRNLSYMEVETPSLLRKYLSLRPGYDNFELSKEIKATRSLEVKDYQQYFKGVPVAYSHYKTLSGKYKLYMMAGSYFRVPETLSVTPTLGEAEALKLAKAHINAKKYVWEEIQKRIANAPNIQFKKALESELAEHLPKGELFVVKDFTNRASVDMRLAYRFNIYASDPISRGYLYIDAQTGKVLLYDAIIKHASVPTTVQTRYSGTRQIYTTQISGNDPNNGQPLTSSHPASEPTYMPGQPTYVLIDSSRGRGIHTYDVNNYQGTPLIIDFTAEAQAKSFTDQDNNWTLPEHKRSAALGGANESQNDDIAWDAHWGAEMVYDYWLLKHKRKSYDDNNAPIRSYVHFGVAYDNAYWNGRVMTYGDGSGDSTTGGFKPLTSIDVCAHEIGHAVCETTANLVYQSESGAMNEGFSDIWASCVENYIIKNVDPSLKNTYKPFFIGEQISYTTTPLRRMDNPKLTGDPDTYGGQFWANPNCVPSDVNDQCGVHNNSGLLNKWFYLITCGSGSGSGPDSAYVIPGADDGMRDAGTTAPHNDGGAYSVTGLGFAISEQLAFLTEIMLTSTATFAEAREVSIATAKAFSGDPCGPIVQSVTNAWYAIGVGAAFAAPCQVTFGFVFQPGSTIDEGRNGQGCTGTDTIGIPMLLPANSTASVSITGSATQGIDFTSSGLTLINNTGITKVDTIFIYLFNDAVIEENETIQMSAVITNTGANIVNTDFSITIADNDVVPKIGKDTLTLLTENFESVGPGFVLPNGWNERLLLPEMPGIDLSDTGRNHWGIFRPGTPTQSKTLAVTGRVIEPLTGLVAPERDGNYINTSPSHTVASSPLIDATGLSGIHIRFQFTVQGEVDPGGIDPQAFGKFDYMGLAYSYDGINFVELGDGYYFYGLAPVTDTFNSILPRFLENKKFHLGFVWYNDTNAGGTFSVSVDNLEVKAIPTHIATNTTNSSNERVNGSQEVYFYTNPDREIIAKVSATGNHNYGCVTTVLEKTGTSAFTLFSTRRNENKVGDKVIRVTPTANNATGSYSISLYLTDDEIKAIEDATLTPRQNLFIYKTTASAIGAADSANTESSTATYTTVPGGGIFTTSFNTGFSAFAIGAPVATALPITCTEFKAYRTETGNSLTWKVSNEQTNKKFEIERSADGINFRSIALVTVNNVNGGMYSYIDNSSSGLTTYYRLKQTDADGSVRYICDIQQIKPNTKTLVIANAYPNPATNSVSVKIASSESHTIHVELLNNVGQMLNRYAQAISSGESTLPIKLNNALSGTYTLRFTDENGSILNTQSIVIRR